MYEWRTREEIDVIREVLRKRRDPEARLSYLRGYLISIPRRKRWGRIDPEIVETFVRRALARERRQP